MTTNSKQITTNLHLNVQNFEMLVIGGVMGDYMKNLGCPSTSDDVNLEFILV